MLRPYIAIAALLATPVIILAFAWAAGKLPFGGKYL